MGYGYRRARAKVRVPGQGSDRYHGGRFRPDENPGTRTAHVENRAKAVILN